MMETKFYQLNYAGHNSYSFVSSDLSFEGFNTKICDVCGRPITTFVYNNINHQFVIYKSKTYPDLMQCCNLGEIPLIFSAKATLLMIEAGITGLELCGPIDIFVENLSKHIEKVTDCPVYYKVIPTGKIDYDYKSMFLKKKRVCSMCKQYNLNRQRLHPVYVDVNKWDGNDFCSLTTFPRQTFCTDKVVDLVKKHKLTGFAFKEAKIEKG